MYSEKVRKAKLRFDTNELKPPISSTKVLQYGVF